MVVWQRRFQAAMVGQLSQHSDGSGVSDIRQTGTFSGSDGGVVKSSRLPLVMIYGASSDSNSIGGLTSRSQNSDGW